MPRRDTRRGIFMGEIRAATAHWPIMSAEPCRADATLLNYVSALRKDSMTRLICLVVIAGFLRWGAAQADQVYRSVGPDGTPVFSDVPQDDKAKELRLKPMNVVPAPTPIDLQLQLNAPTPQISYSLEITEPQNDSTVFINAANLSIRVNVVPPVRNQLGHKLQILMDGKVLAENQSSFTLADADRGSHQIAAQIVDADAKIIKASPAIIVHVQKPSTLMHKSN